LIAVNHPRCIFTSPLPVISVEPLPQAAQSHRRTPAAATRRDRCEGGQPRPLRRVPDGRGRHPTANDPGDLAADRHARQNGQISSSVAVRSAKDDGNRPRRQAALPERGKSAKVHDGSGFIWESRVRLFTPAEVVVSRTSGHFAYAEPPAVTHCRALSNECWERQVTNEGACVG